MNNMPVDRLIVYFNLKNTWFTVTMDILPGWAGKWLVRHQGSGKGAGGGLLNPDPNPNPTLTPTLTQP